MSNAIDDAEEAQTGGETAAPAPVPAPVVSTPAPRPARVTVDTALRDRTLAQITDPTLIKLMSEMSADDQTWLFYAVVADAANRREAVAINHLRDLLSNGAIEGFIQKHLEAELNKVRSDVGANLKRVNESIAELKVIEEEKSIEHMAQFVARKVKADIANQVNSMGADLNQGIERLIKLQKAQGEEHDVNAISKKIAASVSEKVESIGEKIASKTTSMSLLLAGISVICALAFGAMLGHSFSASYSKSEVAALVQATAAETAQQMRQQQAPTNQRRQ